MLTSGLIETAFYHILVKYTANRSSPQVTRYVQRQISGWQNPNPEKIERLLRSFENGWFELLDEFWQGERKDAIASNVNIRNSVAHGRHHGVTVPRVRGYFTSVKEVVEFAERTVLG